MEQKEQFIPFLFDEPVYLIQDGQIKQKSVSAPSSSHSQSSVPDHNPVVTKKRLIVLCSEATPGDMAFLNKILDAIKLSPADYHIGTGSLSPTTVTSDKMLYFGQHALSGANSMYELFQKGSQTILSADPLNILQDDVNRKKLLWTALQKMFS